MASPRSKEDVNSGLVPSENVLPADEPEDYEDASRETEDVTLPNGRYVPPL